MREEQRAGLTQAALEQAQRGSLLGDAVARVRTQEAATIKIRWLSASWQSYYPLKSCGNIYGKMTKKSLYKNVKRIYLGLPDCCLPRIFLKK